ncbi:hypothetical protein BC827DRAFT_1181854 [Russula dissimulans]|nr:hypothetical protein BC827DRAFT_1181854 [Russula dissimulans]
MAPSVRVKRRHAYASILDEDRHRPEQPRDDQIEGGRQTLSEAAATMPSPGSVASPGSPDSTTHLSPNIPNPRSNTSRVNRVVRSSMSYRSFSTDPDSNSPPPTFGRANLPPVPQGTIFGGASADVVVPAPHHHGHAPRTSRVRSALSSSPSRSGPDSDSDSDSDLDSDDEDRVMEDNEHHHDDDVVDHLDVIDPQVATVATLTNTANSILLPPMAFYNRKPVVVLPRSREANMEDASIHTASTDELDRHVHDVLKRKNKFRRVMKGVWAFLKTPLGIVFGIYGILVVFWGSALVFFLAKWIDSGNQNATDLWVEICAQILNGLFCLTGIGLIPWRVVDTYRICKIWSYKRRTRKLRKKAGLPELYDNDDLPDPIYDPNYVHVLTDEQQYELHHQQKKFMKSQTWYRPHGTETHRAFPIATAVCICLLNDGNSVFQCALAACMWSMNRVQRPAWTTASFIVLAFGCGILSGIYIWRGGKKTKRTGRVEERLRRALEMDASQHALPSDGVLAKLQDAITRHGAANKEAGASTGRARGWSLKSSSLRSEKGTEQYRGIPGGTPTHTVTDHASNVASSVHSPTPGIRIEEEMVVPARG